MTEKNNDVMDKINEIVKKRSESSRSEDSVEQVKNNAIEVSKNEHPQGKVVHLPSSSEAQNVGVINQFRMRQMEHNKNLQARVTVLDTELAKLRHQADAAVLESKTFWTAKSAEIAELIKNHLIEAMGEIEIDRMSTINKQLLDASEKATQQLIEIQNREIPDVMKTSLTNDLLAELEETKIKIKQNSLSKKYSLD